MKNPRGSARVLGIALFLSGCADASKPGDPSGGLTPSKLAFTVPPSNTAARIPFAPDVQVTVQDAQGNTVTSSTVSITLTATPAGNGVSPVQAAVGGVATFSNLASDHAGTYTLTASAAGLTSATSDAFTVTAGSATSLAVTTQPTTATAGLAINPAVVVTVLDAGGDAVTTTMTNITVAIGTNPASGTLAGTTSIAISGPATFSNLSIDKAGTGYTLTANAPGLSGATSNAFNVVVGPAATLLKTAGDGQAAIIRGILPIRPSINVRDAGGNVVAGAPVTFSVTAGGGSLTGATTTTNSLGDATLGSWTLGSIPGTNTLTASAANATLVSFTATAVPPPPVIGIFPDVTFVNLPPASRDLFDGTKVNLVKKIFLPSNCPQSFAIANLGPPESTMPYFVIHESGVNEFVYQNGSGSLAGGTATTVTVSVDSEFVYGTFGGPSLMIGSTNVLSILTPQASNFTKSGISFEIPSTNSALVGTWSGTWSGLGYGSGSVVPQPTTPVSGNWVLQVTDVDFGTENVSGSLTWTGTDAVWSSNGLIPSPIAASRVTTFTPANTSARLEGSCGAVTINFNRDFTNPPSNYGPNGFLYLDVTTGSVSTASHFFSNPLWPSGQTGLSGGKLVGSKQSP